MLACCQNFNLIHQLSWDPDPALFHLAIPFLGRPILWYGLLFALGFLVGYFLLVYLLKKYFPKVSPYSVADGLLIYVVLGTLIGARLFDVLFYQDFSAVLKNPLSALYFWEGGLASHGGVVGILVAVLIFAKRHTKLHFWTYLDLLVLPACVAGGFIRIGNFMNQEILGKPTDLPWGIVFLHPAGGGAIVGRHPVQLYEALFYFALGLCLWKLRKGLLKPGRLCGLFFIVCFSFRFLIEGVKEEQSAYLSADSWLTMGQILSLPMVVFGLYSFFTSRKIRL